MDRKTKNPSPAFLLLQWGERAEGKGGIPERLCNHYMFDSNCTDLHPNLWSTPRQECSVIIWVFLAKVTEKKARLSSIQDKLDDFFLIRSMTTRAQPQLIYTVEVKFL